jgi:Raf kinase inhibitor-like YbhB/YbcL family protein
MPRKITLLSLTCVSIVLLAGCAPAPDKPEDPAAPMDQAVKEEAGAPANTPISPTKEAEENEGEEEHAALEMSLTTPAFNHEQAIPVKFSCDGENLSPDLDWFGTPKGTKSLALILDDPDAPVGTWVHWVLFNIPADIPGLQEGITGVGVDGNNSWDRTGYEGPCPPGGTHRYFFKLYALDLLLELATGASKEALLEAIDGHILGQAELMGTYSR